MNRILKKSLLLLFLVMILSFQNSFSQGTIRILPLGNSITYGNMCINGSIGGCVPISGNEAPGYRYRFYELMTAAGWTIDFVGSENSGSNYLSDTHNAGFGGISDDNLATLMETGTSLFTGYKTPGPYLQEFSPEIILLHIGTNDVLGADTSNVNGLRRILDAIDDYETFSGTSIMVFLARILSYRYDECNTQPRVVAYNSKIDQLYAQRKASGDNIILVDMECGAGMDYNSDFEDEVHPNQTGYNKMGEAWFNAVNDYLRSVYIKYTITASATGNGTIDPSGEITVSEGDDQSFNITPGSGYEIEDVKVDGQSKGKVTNYSFSDVTSNHTIEAIFTPVTHTITTIVTGNGSINPSGSVEVNEGDNQVFSFTPDVNHRISDVKVNGSSVGVVMEYEFENLTSDQSIEAIFEPITHTISSSSGANGNINPEGDIIVNQGSDQLFTITPDEGYEVEDIIVDGSSAGAAESYTFTDVDSDHDISVSFKIISYEITTSVTGNGTIDPEGTVSVDYGSDQVFTFTPDANHEIADVRVNGGSVGVNTSYEFRNITSDQSLAVIFEPITHTITASAGTHGSISPLGTVTVNHGSDQSFTIIADEGYVIDEVYVNGNSVGAVPGYTFSNVTEDHSIEVSFKILTYEITVSVTGNGSVNPEGPVTVNYGSYQTFSFTPDDGYEIADVLFDGTSVGQLSVYTITDITDNHNLEVVFELENVIGIDDYNSGKIMTSIYPNPSNGEFSIYLKEESLSMDRPVNLRIMNAGGKIIFHKIYKAGSVLSSGMIRIQLTQEIKKGIYLVEVEYGKKREVMNLVITK